MRQDMLDGLQPAAEAGAIRRHERIKNRQMK
jgi:hypothetical protein